jgi:hypothetical protein
LKKSLQYNILGVLGGLMGSFMILGWAYVKDTQVLYEGLTPALPYLALFEFMLGCLCLVFGYLEGQREVEQEAT